MVKLSEIQSTFVRKFRETNDNEEKGTKAEIPFIPINDINGSFLLADYESYTGKTGTKGMRLGCFTPEGKPFVTNTSSGGIMKKAELLCEANKSAGDLYTSVAVDIYITQTTKKEAKTLIDGDDITIAVDLRTLYTAEYAEQLGL
jgi:hypothetical protein